ncbi:MAG: homoserine kinase, partial [Solobacterium sp.]|nr:homoserine kinase [Solobacterium sp.]
MIIKVPCSTSNLGPGFDCLGLSLDIYNLFSVEVSDEFLITGCEERFANSDNLFLEAYRQTFSREPIPIHVHFDCDIPVSRGLGSSSTLTVGGLVAGYLIQKKPLNGKELLRLATSIEHHPDNAAPCLFGGLCAGKMSQEDVQVYKLPLSNSFVFTIVVPDYEVSTQKARSVLPDSYSREILVQSTSSAILLTYALESGNLELLKDVSKDQIHTPYRKELIKDYGLLDSLSNALSSAFFISGSGSTCMFVSKESIVNQLKDKLPASWRIQEVHP